MNIDAVEGLYATFKRYRLSSAFAELDFGIDEELVTRLAETRLRRIPLRDLDVYSQKALTTWGSLDDFKYFLPRLFELTIEHQSEFSVLEVLFSKLAYGEWTTWRRREQAAIETFLSDYWQYCLSLPVSDSYLCPVDKSLCALARASNSVQQYLATWIETDSNNAQRHLAAFVLHNASCLSKKRTLSNAFWHTNGISHREVLEWLQFEDTLAFLGHQRREVLADDFPYAWEQLGAIQKALATE